MSPRTTRRKRSSRETTLAVLLLSSCGLLPPSTCAFQSRVVKPLSFSTLLKAESSMDDEITRQLERARDVLAKSKAKIEEKDMQFIEETLAPDASNEEKEDKNMPFFASVDAKQESSKKKEKVIKSQNDEGLFTTDGDLMAKMSESEEWEVRPLLEVFESEVKDSTNDPLADRDVAANIFNLRKVLQTEDFQKIFDKRNRWIGEQ